MDIRIAAYMVIIRDSPNGVGQEILLVHWNEGPDHNGWTLPGGGVEGEEHPIEGAVREVFEETGYHARIDRLLGIDRHIVSAVRRRTDSSAPLYALRIIYRGTVTGGELANEVAGSSDEARWVALETVQNLKTVNLVEVALQLNRDEPVDGVPSTLGTPKNPKH